MTTTETSTILAPTAKAEVARILEDTKQRLLELVNQTQVHPGTQTTIGETGWRSMSVRRSIHREGTRLRIDFFNDDGFRCAAYQPNGPFGSDRTYWELL